jgi:predicted glycogen debranching enzyme
MRASQEWLQADGLGGFASGTVTGVRTRRYHALLLSARTPPTNRVVLVNGLEVWAETEHGRFALSAQYYSPDVQHPDGDRRIVSFDAAPWPQWIYRLEDGTEIEQSIVSARGEPVTAVGWRLLGGAGSVRLLARPLLSGRDMHALHCENSAFRFTAETGRDHVSWHPYQALPVVACRTNGRYTHEPLWYRNFLYREERERGLDYLEDLGSPGVFEWNLQDGAAVLLLGACTGEQRPAAMDAAGSTSAAWAALTATARQAAQRHASTLHRAADAYIVQRGSGRTIVAGYPWFSDWGRDTFIALRGLCLATRRYEDAADILSAWARTVSEGMLPNYFPEGAAEPEFNSVDASLWYIVAVAELLALAPHTVVPAAMRSELAGAVEQILAGYTNGTRHGIRADQDGLLRAGNAGTQLTWMDARVGDRPITPRGGKPVEVQALWINALAAGARITGAPRWASQHELAASSFEDRFWFDDGGYLYDVVDVNGEAGACDATFRPNQILAIGGLPEAIVRRERARRVVDEVERRLWTPLGLRSLAVGEHGYTGHYGGSMESRDAAYHQGTVWPWLAGPFIEAWVRVRGATREARHAARHRFLKPLLEHLDDAGLGHVSEIADGDAPHPPRGCPFQAWSVGELLRLTETVLADDDVVRPDSLAVPTAHGAPAVHALPIDA